MFQALNSVVALLASQSYFLSYKDNDHDGQKFFTSLFFVFPYPAGLYCF